MLALLKALFCLWGHAWKHYKGIGTFWNFTSPNDVSNCEVLLLMNLKFILRKPSQSALAKALDKKVQTYVQDTGSDTGSNAVIDETRFKKQVGIQDIPANFMLLTEVTYFGKWNGRSFRHILKSVKNISTMFNQVMENVLLFFMGIRLAHQPKIMNIVEDWWRLLFHQMYA